MEWKSRPVQLTYDEFLQAAEEYQDCMTGGMTEDERESCKKCVESVPGSTYLFTGLLGGATGTLFGYMTLPKPFIKWAAIFTGVTSLLSTRKLVEKMCIRDIAVRRIQDKKGELKSSRQLSAQEAPADMPDTLLSSALDFDDPVYSTQAAYGENSQEADLSLPPSLEEAEIAQPKKRTVTYDELRQKHREEYQNELQNRQAPRTRERVFEMPKKIEASQSRKNKYGDEME